MSTNHFHNIITEVQRNAESADLLNITYYSEVTRHEIKPKICRENIHEYNYKFHTKYTTDNYNCCCCCSYTVVQKASNDDVEYFKYRLICEDWMLHSYYCNIYTIVGTLLVRNDVKIHKHTDTYIHTEYQVNK